MDKLLWVLLPIALAGAAVGVLAWRGRLPPRPVLNVWFSLLLLLYVLITAGLGIFWVANQHLPVFDWHYVFGYALLLLLLVHLGFNLRRVMFHLRPKPTAATPAAAATGRRPLLGAFGVLGLGVAAGLGYFIGLRHGRTELRIEAGVGSGVGDRGATALAVVEQFHDFSAHTRSGVLRRAPGADWGAPPPPFKPPGVGPRLALPAARKLQAATAAGIVDAAALAEMLWHTAGVSARSGGIHFRTSPSSGALFATELYVLTLDIPGVAAGLWHYDVPGHALQQLAAAPADGSLPGAGALPPGSLALVVATAIFRRSGHKYRDRTYRYVLGDLGHALENLRVVALQAGARATLLQAFDEARVATALGLEEQEEGVLAMMLLQGRGAALLPPLPALANTPWQPPLMGGAQGATSEARSGTTLGITDAIHRASSLRAAALPPAGHTPPGPWPGPASTPSSWQRLPPADSRIIDPLALIASRRSVRRYSREPLALADLAAVLATMARPGPLLSNALRVDVLALQVAGLGVGAWRYHAAAHALEPRAQAVADPRRSARAAGLDQDVIGDAAAVFVLAIDRAAFAADPAGAARGYRHAFIESGLVGERVYLEAGARGLGVCAVGAFYDDEAAALTGNDPAREWVVHFAALGVIG